MPLVRPFRAWTFARTGPDISDLCAPPYDVVSEDERADLLARSPHNVVALELPDGPLDPDHPGNRYETGAATWREWRESNVLVREERPAIYALEQAYGIGDDAVRRRAFIAEVRLHSFEEGVVLPHERTLPKALGDRFNLTRATGANLSQVFGLYEDPARATDELFERAMQGEPDMIATDRDDVESRVWTVTEPDLISRVTDTLRDSRVFIADGHHRYTVALAYRDLRREMDGAAGSPAQDPDYDYVMMALVNMDDPELVVLPTHRVADAALPFDPVAFRDALGERFELRETTGDDPSAALARADRPAFLVRTRSDDRPLLAILRADVDVDEAIPGPRSAAWKNLDVTVLLELVLDPLLGIHPDRPETLERLRFVKDAGTALAMADEHDVAFVVRPTRMEQMRAVSLAGDVMPQKSTYFYPKLLSGLVMRGMD